MFKFKMISDKRDRAYGFAFRVFGIDISILVLGYINDWRILDLRIPHNYGIFIQAAFLLFTIGRLPDDLLYQLNS